MRCLPLSYGAASLGTWAPRPSWADLHRGILFSSFLLPALALLHHLLSSLILTARFAHSPPLCYAEPFTQLEFSPRQELGRLEIYPTCKLTSEPPQFHGKDVRCLDQKQRMVYDSRQQQEPDISIVMGQSPSSEPHRGSDGTCVLRGCVIGEEP